MTTGRTGAGSEGQSARSLSGLAAGYYGVATLEAARAILILSFMEELLCQMNKTKRMV